MKNLEKILTILSKWSLVKLKVENKFYMGNNVIHVDKDGKVLIDQKEVRITKDKGGKLILDIEGTKVDRFVKDKKNNINRIDVQQKVFTRADVAATQIEFLKINEEHEVIIKKLKPLLERSTYSTDLGALLSASAVIKVEDEGEDRKLAHGLHDKLQTAYGHRGSMIYNLFRSNILRIEVLNHLNKLKKVYRNRDEVQLHFLLYWNSILEKGYPNAYFVTHDDTKQNLYAEISKRLESGVEVVRIYSRAPTRNKNTEKWCKQFAVDNNCHSKKLKTYRLGFGPAIRIRIEKKKQR